MPLLSGLIFIPPGFIATFQTAQKKLKSLPFKSQTHNFRQNLHLKKSYTNFSLILTLLQTRNKTWRSGRKSHHSGRKSKRSGQKKLSIM